MKTMRQRGLMFRIVVLVMVLSLFPLSFPASADNIIENSPAELEERDESAVRATTSNETEPNNTRADAYRIYNDDTTYGKIGYSGDEDYYKIMFTFSGQANFWLGDIPSGKDYDLHLLNASGTPIASSTTNNSSLPQEYIGHFTVSANTWYYIKVVGYNCYDASANYQLRVREVEQFEEEPNNTMATATQVNDDGTIYGKIDSSGDIDYYKVKFFYSGEANFWLGDIPVGKDFDLYLYNASGTQLASSTSNNNSLQQEFIGSYSVTANTWYYIKVVGYNCYDTTLYYQLRARCYSMRNVRVLYDSTCTLSVTDINSALTDATSGFASTFGITFTRKSTSYSTVLNGASCPNSSIDEYCNGHCGLNTSCNNTHHKGASRLLTVPDPITSMHTCRIVRHKMCFYKTSNNSHIHVSGLGGVGGTETIVTHNTGNLSYWAYLIQHELSHNLGASHDYCLKTDCVLEGTINEWCANCANAVNESKWR